MSNISITGNVFKNGAGDVANVGLAAPAISVTRCRGLTVSGNVIQDWPDASFNQVAMVLQGVSSAVVSSNVIECTSSAGPNAHAVSIGDYVLVARDIVFNGNIIVGYLYGIYAGTSNGVNNPLPLCSDLTFSNNVMRYLQQPGIRAIYIDANTPRVRIFNNQIESPATTEVRLETTCQMFNNVVDVVTIYNAAVTYYWEEEKGRKTYRPAPAAPTVLPTGVTWSVGDLQYNSAPATTGDPVGWVYTSANVWRGFGALI